MSVPDNPSRRVIVRKADKPRVAGRETVRDYLDNAVGILVFVAVVGVLIWVGGDLYAWLVDHYVIFILLLIGLPILTAFAVYNGRHHLSPNMLAEMLSTTVGIGVLSVATLVVFMMAIGGTVKDAHSYHHGVCWQLGEWPDKGEKVFYYGCAPGRWDSYAKDNGLYCDPLYVDEPDTFESGEWRTIKRLGLVDAVEDDLIGIFRCTEVPAIEP
jgi:hypothetical protein